ncbi:phosphoesterase PA-phosphatase-like protein [Hyphomonas oceanitis SCH89]|uniref:Phosphoesterase PA-phosphatase-like protein n=2 Tax=Hyphomonas oceanitis TaxID=81033 RepID=A0A059GAM6_9PROT|nr:phosphoesterase PA-phosphatase-like protein [Hyphomonas oceanitis SCH89]
MRRTALAVPAALCALVLALLVSGIAGLWDIDVFDRSITDQVPGLRTPALTNVMLFVSAFGDAVYLWFMGPLVLVTLGLYRNWRALAAYSAVFVLTPIIVRLVKAWVARPRPTVDLYGGVEAFSFPSGHATNSTLIYGGLALLALMTFKGAARLWAVGCLSVLILLIAASRIYVGAHWPSDTLAGLALGGLMLCGLGTVTEYPANNRSTLFTVTALALTGPLYALLTLPAARMLYHALG